MKRRVIPFLAAGFATVLLGANQEETQRLQASADVLQQVMGTPDKGIPSNLFHRAYCVIVIPGMKKAGFVFSGKYGRGYASCRAQGGGWSAPAAMRIEGGGFGLQAGGASTDVVMLVMSSKGMNGILSSKFTLGGEASVAAGPVGREATAQTDASMHADILSWSRSRGVFGGISLQGATLRPDKNGDKALYGHKVDSKQVLTGQVKDPASPDPFTSELAQYGGTHRS
ncbi:MAG TPA: lipid-binding SYLF domain-containing protein [Bryobacteraceae bacterium]